MMQAEHCKHKGCKAGPATGQSLFNAGKGAYCAKHFTEERHADPLPEEKKDEK